MRDRAHEESDPAFDKLGVDDLVADAFDRAVEIVLQHEGGLVDDPDDPGGITKYGISYRFLRHRRVQPGSTPDDIRKLTRAAAIELYRRHFWERYGYGRLPDMSIATKVFDLSVNMGPRSAHKCLQRALRAAGERVDEDGALGPQTVAAVHQAAPGGILAALRSEAAGYYRNRRRPKYIAGWLNRAYS